MSNSRREFLRKSTLLALSGAGLPLIGKAVVPFTHSMELYDDPASTMIYNCKKGIIKCIAVNIPWAAGIEKENL